MKMLLEDRTLGRADSWFGESLAAGELRARRPTDLQSRQENAPRSRGIRKILLATDFSPSCTKAMEYAVALARQLAAALTVLHVIDINPPEACTHAGDAASLMWGLRVHAITEMDRLACSLAREQVQTQQMIVEGLPPQEILEQSKHSDLVVLGAQPAKRSWNLFSKHTAQCVMEAAPCPVLLVRGETGQLI
jgi:universal stress protein E